MTEQKNQKLNSDLKLWLLIGAIAIILIGIGLLIAAFSGEGVGAIFEKFAEPNIALLIISIVLVLIGVIGIVIYQVKKPESLTRGQWTVKEMVVGALCIGLAFVLSYIRIWHMPMGGSITPASMLPIMLFAYIYGTPKGLIVAVAYGVLQLIQDSYIVHWVQLILDYILAFGSLALAGLFRKSILPGIVVAGLGRFLFATLSGVIFFGEYAPEGQSALVYSLSYQATYLIPEIVICLVIALIPAIRSTIEQLKKQALKKS